MQIEGTNAQAAPQTSPATEPQQATPPTQPEAKPKEDIDFSSKFAALTRKERQIVERERALKAMQSDPSYKEYETFKQLKADPRRNAMKLIESLGVPINEFYNDLTGLVLNDGKPNVELELKSLRDQIEADKKERMSAKEAEAQAVREADIAKYKGSIFSEVEKDPDTFEFMNAYAEEAYDLAFDTAFQYFEQTGQIPNPREVCAATEKYYEERAKKLLTLKKLGVKTEVPPPETPDATQKPTASKTTLTNVNTTAAAPMPNQPPLDPEKRKAWTAAKLKAAWNK